MTCKRVYVGSLLASVLTGCMGELGPGSEDPLVPAVPCADGTWGPFADPGSVLLVHAEPSAPSQAAAVFADLPSARDAAASQGGGLIAISAGEWPSSIVLDDDSPPIAASVHIQGCSADEAILVAASDAGNQPLVDASGSGALDIELRDLTLRGGRNALTVRGGAELTAERLVIEESTQTGAFVSGQGTVATLIDVVIRDSLPENGSFGWGLAVSGVGTEPAFSGRVEVVRGAVEDNQEIGVFVDHGTLTMSETSVSRTALRGGRFGRGLHSQEFSDVELNGVVFDGNADAAVFARQPTRLHTNDVVIIIVPLADLPDGAPSGDGIVATRASAEEGNTSPALYDVSLIGTTMTEVHRAGILLEGVTAVVEDTSLGSSVIGVAGTSPDTFIYSTDDADVTVDPLTDGADYEPIGPGVVTVDAARLLAP